MNTLRDLDINDSTVVGVTWYSPLEWDTIPDHVADPETFNYPYQEWLSNAYKTIDHIQQSGSRAHRIPFRIADFIQWCRDNAKEPNAAARCEYTIAETKKIFGDG